MKTFMQYVQLLCVYACLAILTAQPAYAATEVVSKTPSSAIIPAWVEEWIGYDTSAMSDTEFESMVCITAGLTMGTLITVVGGTAIVIGGHVGRATGTAIALPVLISSMWSSCALSRAVLPGVLWLHRRSTMLVKKLGGNNGNKTNNDLPPIAIDDYEAPDLQFGQQQQTTRR